MRLRVISWIESLPTAGDPLNHTKNHEKQNRFLSFMEQANMLAGCTVILETLHSTESTRLLVLTCLVKRVNAISLFHLPDSKFNNVLIY